MNFVSAQGFLGSEVPKLRSLWTEEFLGSGFPGHPRVGHILKAHTEGTSTRTLVNVGDLCQNSGECQGSSREHEALGSPKFARLHQSSAKGAPLLLVRPAAC